MDSKQARPAPILQRAILAVVGLALAAAGLAVIFGRSAWYDEYYTFYITRPGVPLRELWAGWLRDNHPPLFYFLAWATGWLGPDVPARRLLNLAIGAIAALALWGVARRRQNLGPLLFWYTLGLGGALPFVVRVAELRSNFLAFAAASVAVAALVAFGQAPARRGRDALFLGLSLGVAFTVHLAATIILGCLAVAFGLQEVLARDWKGARRFAAIVLAASLPFAACMAIQFDTISGNTRSFWIPGGFAAARWTIQNEIAAGLHANLPLTIAGMAGIGLLVIQDARDRRVSDDLARVLTLGLGMGLAIIVLIALHLQRPFVIGRYLVAVHPVLAMILACGAAAVARAVDRRLAALIALAVLVGSLAAIHRNVRRTLDLPGWDGTASAIAEEVRACPATVVHPALAWNGATMTLAPVDNRAVVPFAYRMVAARHGFSVADETSRQISRSCPTLFWAEHVPGPPPTGAELLRSLQAQGYPVTSGKLAQIGDGWIFVSPPADQTKP